MKTIKISLFSIIIIIFYNCHGSRSKINFRREFLTEEDSLFVEQELLDYKNILFYEVYRTSYDQTLLKKNIKICDTLKDLTYYFYSNFNIGWSLEDKNQDKLIKNWVNKEEYEATIAPHDHPDGSLDLARALDFYNSKDLAKFIDSLRSTEYKRISNLKK